MFGFVKSVGLPAWPALLHNESGGRMKVTFLGTNRTLLINKKEWLPYTPGELEKVDTLRNKRRWGALKAGLKELREALNGEKEDPELKTPKKATKSDNKEKDGLRKQQRDNEQKFAEVMKKLVTRQWQCLRCNFKTGFKYRAKTHAVLCSSMFRARKKRNKVYSCDSCPETTTFSSKRLLNRHTNKEHPRIFLCVEHTRPISFTWRQNLLRHIEEKHPVDKKKIKTLMCPDCGLKTYRKDNISRHVKRRHPRRQEVIELLLNLAGEVVETMEERRQNKYYVESLLDQILMKVVEVKEISFKESEDDIGEDQNKSQNLNNMERIVKRILETVREKRQIKTYVESLIDQILNKVVTGHNNTDYEQIESEILAEVQKRKNEETGSAENVAEPKRKVARMKVHSFKSSEDIEDDGASLVESKSQKVDCLERIEANKKEFKDLWNELFKEEIETKRKLRQINALKNMAKKEALKRKREAAAHDDEPRRKSARLFKHSVSPSGDNIIEQEVIYDSDSKINNKFDDTTPPVGLKGSVQYKEYIKKNINIVDLSDNSDENNKNINATEVDSDIDDHDKENVKPNKKTSSKKYECNKHSKCSYKARDNFNLRKHMRMKHEEGPVPCTKPWCKVMFKTLFELELHVKLCISICSKCGKSFSRPSKWYEHQRYEAAREVKLSM